MKIDKVTGKKKSTWKKEEKEKVISKLKKRMSEEMEGKAKCRAIENYNWGRKEYMKDSNSGTIKDIIKIRLHMCEVKANYGRKDLDSRCPMRQSEGDTTKHVLEFDKRDKKFNLNDERGKEWGQIVEIYRKNKKSRSILDIEEEQNILEEQKKREGIRRRKNLREDRRRQISEKKKIREKEAEKQ